MMEIQPWEHRLKFVRGGNRQGLWECLQHVEHFHWLVFIYFKQQRFLYLFPSSEQVRKFVLDGEVQEHGKTLFSLLLQTSSKLLYSCAGIV